MEDDEGDGDGGGDEPPVIIFKPLPVEFLTRNGNYSQFFTERAQRPAPAADSDIWSANDYLRFSIGSGGYVHAVYLGGGPESDAGYINWHPSGEDQKLDFHDTLNNVLYSFKVLDYSSNFLHLQDQTGGEKIFSAGVSNISGVVVDSFSALAGFTVELWTTDSPMYLDSRLTDSRGYFEFDGLGAYNGQFLTDRNCQRKLFP